ncbi:hypothetical protein, partial [Aeromonas veronii]
EQSRAEQSRAEQSRAEQRPLWNRKSGLVADFSADGGGGDATPMSRIYISLVESIARREPEAPFFVSGNVMAVG